MGVRSTQAVTQTVANANDPNVAAYFRFAERSAGPYNGLVVPLGCAGAGSILTQHGTPIYSQTGPFGLPAITLASSSYFQDVVTNHAVFDPGSQSMVVEAWINPTITTTGVIVSKFRVGGWFLRLSSNRAQFFLQDGAGGGNSVGNISNQTLTPGSWYYLRGVWDPNTKTASIFVNEDPNYTRTDTNLAVGTIADTTAPLCVGSRGTNGTEPFTGSIANLRVTIGNSTNNLGYNTVAKRNINASGYDSSRAMSQPNVAAYMLFDQTAIGPYNRLVVPYGSSAGSLLINSTAFGGTSPKFGIASPIGSAAGGLGDTAYFRSASANSTDGFDVQGQDFVIEMLARVNSTGVDGNIFTKGGYNVARPGYTLYVFQNKIGVSCVDQNSNRCIVDNGNVSNLPTLDTNWHWWRATWVNSTGTLSLYLDGVLAGTATVPAMSGGSLSSIRFAWMGTVDGAGQTGFNCDIALYRLTIGNSTNDLGYNVSRAVPGKLSSVSKQTPGNTTDPNVAAYFSMNEGSGNLTVPAGCAAAGTVFTSHGSPKYGQAAPAGLGTAIALNGTTDFFETGADVPALNLGTSDAVWEFWLYLPSAPGNSSVILNKFDGPGNKGWNIDFNGVTGRPRIQVNDGAGHTSLLTHTTVLSLNTWHYIRCTWSFTNQVVTMAIDGGTPQVGTTATGITSITNTVTSAIGARNVFDDRFLACSLADLRVTIGNTTNQSGIANPVLTPTVVQRPGNVTDPNVAAYFNMEQASGNLVVPAGCSLAGVVASKQGSPVYGITAGVPNGLGKAIQFAKATSDRFQNASASSFLGGATGLGTQDMVVEFWAQTPAPSGSHEFITQGGYFSGPFGSGGFYAIILNGVMTVSVSSTAVAPVASVSAPYPQDTNWHYWRVTWKNSTGTLTFYLDDVLQGTAQVAALAGVSCTSTRQFRIGLSLDQAIGLDGQIADIRITFGNATNRSGYNSSGRAPTY